MSLHTTRSGLEAGKINDALSTGCACDVKHEYQSLIDSFLEGRTPGDEKSTLILLTLLHVTSEAAVKSLRTRKICPALLEIVKNIDRQCQIVQITLKVHLATPDNFIRHSCMLTLSSLATLNESIQSEVFRFLDEEVTRFDTLLQEERDRYYKLIGFMLSQQSRSSHPQHGQEPSCPSLEACEPQRDDDNGLNPRLENTVRKWWSAVHTKREDRSLNVCSCSLLKMWYNILKHCPNVVTFDDRSVDCLLAVSTGECAILSNLALEILDEGLCSLTMEADLCRTASWIPLLSAKVTEALCKGWLQRLPYRNDTCGFGGTLREPIVSATKRLDASPIPPAFRNTNQTFLATTTFCTEDNESTNSSVTIAKGIFSIQVTSSWFVTSTSTMLHLTNLRCRKGQTCEPSSAECFCLYKDSRIEGTFQSNTLVPVPLSALQTFDRKDNTFVVGDGRMLRRALLITLKASVACIYQGESEVVTDIHSKAFAWVSSKSSSVAPRLTVEDCLVRTFIDQDDQLTECLLMELLLHLKLPGPMRDKSSPSEQVGVLNPHLLFLHFLTSLGNDHTTLVDLVTSDETCALLYFVRYLKLVLSDWDAFLASHKCFENSIRANEFPAEDTTAVTDRTMAVLIRLRMKLERMSQKGLVPFNVGPLLRLIERCESLYEEAS